MPDNARNVIQSNDLGVNMSGRHTPRRAWALFFAGAGAAFRGGAAAAGADGAAGAAAAAPARARPKGIWIPGAYLSVEARSPAELISAVAGIADAVKPGAGEQFRFA